MLTNLHPSEVEGVPHDVFMCNFYASVKLVTHAFRWGVCRLSKSTRMIILFVWGILNLFSEKVIYRIIFMQ